MSRDISVPASRNGLALSVSRWTNPSYVAQQPAVGVKFMRVARTGLQQAALTGQGLPLATGIRVNTMATLNVNAHINARIAAVHPTSPIPGTPQTTRVTISARRGKGMGTPAPSGRIPRVTTKV